MDFFYTILTPRVIVMVKTSLDVFSLQPEHFWTCFKLGYRICVMKKVSESGQHGIKT